jgi:hypothetical protein
LLRGKYSQDLVHRFTVSAGRGEYRRHLGSVAPGLAQRLGAGGKGEPDCRSGTPSLRRR